MKLLKLVFAATVLVLSTSADAILLTFDDIPGGSNQDAFSPIGNYNGFDFSCPGCLEDRLDWIDAVGSTWNYGSVSGDFAMVNNVGGIGVITEENNADFTFGGLWAKHWGTAPESGGADGLFGTLSGYNNGNLVWEVATGLNGSYEYYGFQAGAIDELRLGFGDYFLVDDMSLITIPVPASAWLFVSGLIGLVGFARSKKA